MDIVRRFAAKKATGQSSGLTKNMIPKPPKTFRDLARLCLIFGELELFLWLQRKFPPGNMIEQQAAFAMRERAIQYISDGLNNVRKLLRCPFSIVKCTTNDYSHECSISFVVGGRTRFNALLCETRSWCTRYMD